MSRKRKNKLKTRRRKREASKPPQKINKPTYSGEYKGLKYCSCLELAVILHCEKFKLKISNYNLDPIEYWDDLKQKTRSYYPDFIIEDFLIVEVKGFWPKKKVLEILNKQKALEQFCYMSGNYWSIMVDRQMIGRNIADIASSLHKKLKKEGKK